MGVVQKGFEKKRQWRTDELQVRLPRMVSGPTQAAGANTASRTLVRTEYGPENNEDSLRNGSGRNDI